MYACTAQLQHPLLLGRHPVEAGMVPAQCAAMIASNKQTAAAAGAGITDVP
jgi:hypothetical protein